MAYQVGAGCFDTAAVAVQSLASAFVPVAGPDMVISVASVTDSAINFLYTPVGSGVPPFTVTQAVVLQPCNMLTTTDAVDVGWAIGGAWLSIYAITFLIRYFWGETQGTTHAGDS